MKRKYEAMIGHSNTDGDVVTASDVSPSNNRTTTRCSSTSQQMKKRKRARFHSDNSQTDLNSDTAAPSIESNDKLLLSLLMPIGQNQQKLCLNLCLASRDTSGKSESRDAVRGTHTRNASPAPQPDATVTPATNLPHSNSPHAATDVTDSSSDLVSEEQPQAHSDPSQQTTSGTDAQKELQECISQLKYHRYHHVRRYVSVSFLSSYHTEQTEWPIFHVTTMEQDHLLNAFTHHLKESKSIALVPIMATKYQLVFYVEKNELIAMLLPKFHLVLDIDDTLIRTRVPSSAEEEPLPHEQNLFIPVKYVNKDKSVAFGKIRFFISKRAGVSEMLLWAAQLFHVTFVTNGAYVYARAILHYLDPSRQHILKYVGTSETALKEILKSREDLLPHSICSKVGLKKLQLFDLPLNRSVILDDDMLVWHVSNHSNLLPFQKVTQAQNSMEFLNTLAECIWKQLEALSAYNLEDFEKVRVSEEISRICSERGITPSPSSGLEQKQARPIEVTEAPLTASTVAAVSQD